MSFDISEWGRHSFAFDLNSHSDGASPTAVAVHEGPLGATATIPDSHLLFTAHFERAGADLILRGDDGKSAIVHDYFASEHRAQLLSPNGASLSADVVAALAGPLAPGQYAQAGQGNPTAQAVGRVVKVDGDATIVRNGLVVTLHVGDAILKGDVLRTGSGTLGVTFNDGSTLNLTEHARLVVNQFVYDQQNSNNSEILHLVQGSLTFISGQVAHQGHMQINTPVATLGIRGTVGGVTEANDGTVSFFVAESAVGAVLTDNQGHVLAQVLQSGPTFIVRPAGPLNVLAEEVQKTPAELARELAVVQQMTSLQSVGQQIIQQFFQPNNDNNPNPQSNGHPHTQIQILFPTITTVMDETTHTGGTGNHVTATVTTTDGNGVPFGPTQIFDIPVPNGVTPPNAPAILAADDRGPAAGAIVNGGSTNDPTPVIHVDLSGTNALAGDAVELFNGTTAVGLPVLLTAANIAAGFVDITTPALADGAYHLNASITDTAGYTSPASNVADFTVDTVAPTLAPIAPAAYSDTSAPDHFDATTGTLVGNDAAGAAALTYGIDGGAADTSHGGYNIAEAGTYGTLYVNSASGAYEFIPNDAAVNSLSTTATEHFTVTVTDPAGNKAHQDFAVTLTGANDAPVVVGNTSTAGNHDLVNNLGGTAGFGENVLAANDDGSTPAINITSVFGSEGLNFFGTHFTSLYVNNNGNITFNSANGEYTPQHIDAGAGNPIIAPFWADVDTRGGAATATTGGHSTGSNLVYYDLDTANHVFTVTWDDVGYYNHHTNLLDAFQLQLVGTGYGNFDIVFRYESINWTTGDASGGSGGLGGNIARAGYSAGDGIAGHYHELSGSGDQSAMLALSSTPGDTGVAGVQVFEVNSGIVTGASAASGIIQFTDPETADTHTANFVPQGASYIGAFALDDPASNGSNVTEANGGNPGSVAWHFSLTSQQIDTIPLTQSYDVTIADNHNAAVTQTVSVTIGGPGNDTFVFDANQHLGADTIVNFHVPTGGGDQQIDHIELDGFAFHDSTELAAAITANTHNDAVINLGHGDTVTVAGVTADYLTSHIHDLIHLNSIPSV